MKWCEYCGGCRYPFCNPVRDIAHMHMHLWELLHTSLGLQRQFNLNLYIMRYYTKAWRMNSWGLQVTGRKWCVCVYLIFQSPSSPHSTTHTLVRGLQWKWSSYSRLNLSPGFMVCNAIPIHATDHVVFTDHILLSYELMLSHIYKRTNSAVAPVSVKRLLFVYVISYLRYQNRNWKFSNYYTLGNMKREYIFLEICNSH